MTSEWDGTAWGGTAVSASSLPVPTEGRATVKAATGWQSFYNGVNQPLSSASRSPARMMREAQAMYYANPWIRRAESTVSSKVAGLPWHIEDRNDEEVDDQTVDPRLQAVRDLLEKPQAALPPEDRQPGITTRRGLISLTSRHMGLCGPSYWFLDQMDQGGLPLALLYLNPARMTPKVTKAGNLLGWALDADDYGNGGVPLRIDQVLPFYLDVPDFGAETTGLVATAALKARIVTAADVHVLSVFGTGGRIAGLVSPKDGYVDNPDQFAQMERDFRNVNEAPDAAKRMTIVRGAIDFNQTGQDLRQLGLVELQTLSRDDIFATWGVPPSQAGIPHASGLNAGTQGQNENEVLMTGPVHDRVVAISETIQFDLLDRWQTIGLDPQLVIEEPDFDDEAPAYELASKAREQPLTLNERRAIIKLDPLPDYGPDGDPLGVAIVLPSLLTTFAQGQDSKGTPENPFPGAPAAKPPPVNLGVLPPPPPAQLGAGAPPPPVPAVAKAGLLGLRAAVDKRVIPTVRKALERFLAEQRTDIASRIRGASTRQLKDPSYWFRGDAWDKALDRVLRPHIAGISQTVTARAQEVFTAKASFDEEVERYVLEQTGLRIKGINQTTREAIGQVIRDSLDESLTASDIADRISDLPTFDEARAELVARTELGFAYNTAAIRSYGEYGVQQVQAIDGDGDPVCAERNGKVFSLEEAQDIEDHPNGTLDWLPIVGAAA